MDAQPGSSTRYIVKITVPEPIVAGGYLPLLQEWLGTLNIDSIAEEIDKATGQLFVEVIGVDPGLKAQVVEKLNAIQGLDASVLTVSDAAAIEEQDWAEHWKTYWKTTELFEGLVIQPSWEQYEAKPGETVILLDPGCAFGTGSHETTRLMLELIHDTAKTNPNSIRSVLDVGCGSGILAIYACKLGAQAILAIDNDIYAVNATIENAELNGCTKIDATDRDISTVLAEAFDMVVANILAPVIIDEMENLVAALKPDGVLLLGGILTKQAGEVGEAVKAHGLTVKYTRQLGDWVGLVCRR